MRQADEFKFNELTYCVGSADGVIDMINAPALTPFADEAVDFLNELSKLLMKSGRGYSDVISFAFWCRRSALLKEKQRYENTGLRLGRGVVMHSTPSNVPVNFAFSFASGLIAGNKNLVRLPAKPFPQVEIITQALNELLSGGFKHMRPYVVMVKFPPVKAITDAFSSICDTRVIWGGDATIAEIRQSPLPPRANEIAFADRHSVCVINAAEYLKAEDKPRIASDFYNDTYFTDQNACTSPRAVVWLAEDDDTARCAKAEFWRELYALAKPKYDLKPVQTVGKLHAACRAAALLQGVNIVMEPEPDALITRLKVDKLTGDIMRFKYNSGFFFEYTAGSLDEILPLATLPCQTLLYYGVDTADIEAFVKKNAPRGIDRAVPIGRSMDFKLLWDGYDLVLTMSRVVGI